MKLFSKSAGWAAGVAAIAAVVVATTAPAASASTLAADLAATQYSIPGPVNLAHESGVVTTLATGPVLPAGNWLLSTNVYVLNGTGQADTLRCGLTNGAGGLVAGTGTTIDGFGYASLSVPALVTLVTPERINLTCSHDSNLPAGTLRALGGVVVAQQVAARF